MIDLSTKYLGLNLRNPIIVGSSGLTNSVEDILNLEKYGAGAVILKSLFEEEIILELEENRQQMNKPGTVYPEMFDFFDYDTVEDSVSKYLNMIEELKKKASIPIIPSINCVSANEWTAFAKQLQSAGADAIELNLFILPSDFSRSGIENEKIYFDVIEKVKKEVTIPVSLKISYYFSNLGMTIQKLSETNIDGLVLFNRFYSPDFDIDNFRVVPTNVLSNPGDLSISLRWIAIMAERVKCDLAASTGVHNGPAVIKQLLAGANAVQMVSSLYNNGPEFLQTTLKAIEIWMEDHEYTSIDEFRGKMSQAQSNNPAAYERVQFMKYFAQRGMHI